MCECENSEHTPTCAREAARCNPGSWSCTGQLGPAQQLFVPQCPSVGALKKSRVRAAGSGWSVWDLGHGASQVVAEPGRLSSSFCRGGTQAGFRVWDSLARPSETWSNSVTGRE